MTAGADGPKGASKSVLPARPPDPAAPGLGWAGRLGVLLALAAVLWIGISAAGELDRSARTTTIDGFDAAGPIHLAPDGRITLARNSSTSAAPDGRIEAFDIATRARTTLLDSASAPIAADVAPDGTVCAIGVRPSGTGDIPWLRCSSGLQVEIGPGVPAGLRGGPDLDVPVLADIVSDGGTGWFVSDRGRAAILHVAMDGQIEVVATITQYDAFPRRPMGLARSARTLLAGISDGGYAGFAVTDRNVDSRQSSWITSGVVVAIAGTSPIPIALVRDVREFLVTYPVMADAEHPRLVDGLQAPGGLVILGDGRIAVTDGSRLIIVRPKSPLP